MGKGKPRHDPEKRANKYGRWCPYFETYYDGKVGCEASLEIHNKVEDMKCRGDRHSCVKVIYQKQAIKRTEE